MSDPWEDPEILAWKRHVEDEVTPMIEGSTVCISLCPPRDKVDIKFAVELGMMIMLDKPILVVAQTNDDIPAKMRLIADKIVIGQVGEPGFQERMIAALKEMGE